MGARGQVGQSYAERRQFGRRSSNIKGYAVLPGHVLLPCVIVNLSDGGALLSFDGDVKLPASLRLVVDDTSFNLLCEVRHQTGNKVGVRFARLAQGIAFNRHFQRVPTEPADCEIKMQSLRPAPVTPPASNRELRRAVFGFVVGLETDVIEDDPREDDDDGPLSANPATLAALTALARQCAHMRAPG